MAALLIVLLLAALFLLQGLLYSRLWGKGLEVKIAFREEYAVEDDTAVLTEVVVNDKLLPLPVVEVDFHMDKGLRFSGEANTAVSDRSYRRDVFVADANEGIVPHHKASLPADIEEERRLFYVALTRAKERLHILAVRERYHRAQEVSRFVGECLGGKM